MSSDRPSCPDVRASLERLQESTNAGGRHSDTSQRREGGPLDRPLETIGWLRASWLWTWSYQSPVGQPPLLLALAAVQVRVIVPALFTILNVSLVPDASASSS